MNTPETTEIPEARTKTTRPNRKLPSMKPEALNSARRRRPAILRKSEAPALSPDEMPDCDDEPMTLAARRLAAAGSAFQSDAEPPIVTTDPNSGLIDELEWILRGDSSEPGPVGDETQRFPSFSADPLSFFRGNSDPSSEENTGANTALFAEPIELDEDLPDVHEPTAPKPAPNSVDAFDDGDRDGFDFFDKEPPRSADFWHSEDETPPRRRAAQRRRRGFSRGYMTISALLVLVAAGGIYSTVQFSGDPARTLPGGADVVAASAFGSPAAPAPRLVETTEVVAAAPEAEPAEPIVGAETPAAETPTVPAAAAAAEPRIVPLFREPDDAAPAEPAVAGFDPVAEETPPPVIAAAPAEPVANEPPPPPPAAIVAGAALPGLMTG